MADDDDWQKLSATKVVKRHDGVSTAPVSKDSLAWARMARPFVWFLLALLACVVIGEYALFAFDVKPWQDARAKAISDWGNAVLPPIVGFVSAVVGYLFGARSADSSPPPENQ